MRVIQLYISFFVVILICNYTFAQSRFCIGLTVGENFPTTVTDDPYFQPEALSGFVFGASCQLRLYRSFYLQSGLQFLQKKADFSYPVKPDGISGTSVNETTQWQYNYIEIPLLIKYKHHFEKISPCIFLGFNFGFINSYEIVTKRSGIIKSTKNELNIAGLFSDDQILDLSPEFGVGAEYKINETMSVFVNGSYLNGLASIYKYSTWKWRNFRMTSGILYHI